ncbi:AraC family transcriptional regulator [Tropicimonas sp. S265A]|uniref:helix-turn-helix transcriptional regulator n=1 Tax=Tropicimonas sp. S265A TaxID=3415134 RepID=UPI003C7A8F41
MSSLAAIQSTGNWRLASLHAEDVPVLFSLTRGQGRVILSGRTRGLTPPSYLFVPAHHAMRFEFSGPVFGTKLRLDPASVPELPSEPRLLRSLAAQDQRTLTHHLNQIEEERTAARKGADRAVAAHANLLCIALDRAYEASGAPSWTETKSQQLSARFMALVEEDIANGTLDGPSVGDYADRLGITATHLTRVCQAETGQGASSYLQDRLLSEARRRLKETRQPVNSIARQLGYRSAAYFTRAFGARMGETPSAARNATTDPAAPNTGTKALRPH